MKNQFGENLKKLRTSQKISRKVLAEKLNISDSTLAGWENAHREPPLDKVIEVAEFFNVSVDSLVRSQRIELNLSGDSKFTIDLPPDLNKENFLQILPLATELLNNLRQAFDISKTRQGELINFNVGIKTEDDSDNE